MIKNKVFRRFFITFLLIVILYTTIVTILVGSKNRQLLFMRNNHSNEVYLDQLSTNLDYKLDMAFKFVDKISSLDSIHNHINSTKTNYAISTNIYNDLVNGLGSFEQLGFTVGVTKFADNFVISSAGSFTYDNYLDSIGVNKYYLAYLDKLFSTKESHSDYYLVPQEYTSENSTYLTIIRKINYAESHESLYYLITFDKSNFLPDNLPNDKGLFSIVSNDLIASYKTSSYNNFTFNIEDLTNTEATNVVSTSNLSKDLLTYSIKSKALGELKYMYIFKESDLVSSYFNLAPDLLILNLILFILGILVIYFATKRNYLPIDNIIKSLRANVNSVTPNDLESLDKFDELEYIINTIDKLNTENNALELNLTNSLSHLQENFFRTLLYGITFDDDIQKSISDLKLDMYKNGGTLCLLSLEGKSELEDNLSKNNILSLRNKLLYVFADEIKFISIPLNYKHFCLIFIEKDTNIINHNLTNMINVLEDDLSLDITSSAAKPVNHIIEFQSAFNEASTLITKKYSYIDTRVINSESIISINDDNYFYYPINKESFLINYINTHDLDKALSVLNLIFDKNLNELNIHDSNLTKLKYALINTIKRILNENDKSITDFSKLNPNLINDFNASTRDNLREVSINLLNVVFTTYIETDLELNNPLVTNILLYIQDNFDKDISLTTISDHFKLSEGYISKLLKSTANINFKNYVNTLKVSKAKKMLSTGKYKVNEVSAMVGCDNTNTFIRIFKKYEGISPGEFIKLQ